MASDIYKTIPCDGVIRILLLEPGNFGDEIKGQLIPGAVDIVRPGFTALSYAWGNGPEDVRITINGNDFYVRHNLSLALHRIRSPTRYVPLWADAICGLMLQNLKSSDIGSY